MPDQHASAPKKRYPNSGILSRNDRAKDNPKAAPYSGQIEVDCPHCKATAQFWMSAWVKERREGGGKFFSLSFKPKDGAPKGPKPPAIQTFAHQAPNPAPAEPAPETPLAEDDGEYRY